MMRDSAVERAAVAGVQRGCAMGAAELLGRYRKHVMARSVKFGEG